MLSEKSSLALVTVAISITCPTKRVEGKLTLDKTSFGHSISMHNSFNVETVDFHRPQQGATGTIIPV